MKGIILSSRMRNHLFRVVLTRFDPSHSIFLKTRAVGSQQPFSSGNRKSTDDARVIVSRGLPHLILRLPSRSELCDFSLKPTTHRIEDLIRFIRDEDKGIQHVALLNADGERLSNADTIESLLSRDFIIEVNNDRHAVAGLDLGSVTNENFEHLNDVKGLINRLYIGINLDAHQLAKERKICDRLHDLKQELAPYEEMKQQLTLDASRRTRRTTWVGLAAMGLQFGLLCRLTWWEYSWDIMEPVTYFIGQSYIIMMFAYYVLTRQEYQYVTAFNRVFLKRFYKRAKKADFPVDKYNKLQDEIFHLEKELHRLRDPLVKRLPLQQDPFLSPSQRR